MSPDAIAQAFALFQQLRDQRTHRCDYRYSELAAFRKAVESIEKRSRKKKGRVAPALP